MPRLRGVTIESDYEVANQRRVLVASQRLGFTDLIDGATSKWLGCTRHLHNFMQPNCEGDSSPSQFFLRGP